LYKRYTVLFYVITFTILFLFHAATASAGSTTLSWYPPTANEDGTPLTDLAGYKIYYGTASRSYTQIIDVGNKTIQTVPNLSEGVTYYFAVTAYNTAQKESKYSNEIGRTISLYKQYNLTVNRNGTGTGTVTSSPGGIICGSDCTEVYNAWTLVTLTATPDGSSTFSGWSGACTGIGACIVTIDAAKSITATFTLKTYTITATAGTGGSISPSGSIVVNHGSNQIFSITADTEYEIAKVLVDGKSVGTAGVYTFTDVTASHTISAKFANLADGTIADSYFINLPMTGQTESYAFEDDGDIEAGIAWPEQRFLDNGDGTVTDTLTGLMWLKDGGCLNKKKWNDALITIVEMNANPGRYSCTGYSANYRDWRLPNVRELDSLIHYGEPDSSAWLNTIGFTNMKGSYYWSSTTNSGATQAGVVNLYTGIETTVLKSKKTYALAVRSVTQGNLYEIPMTGQTMSYAFGDDGDIEAGTAWPEQRFLDNGDGTVTDTLTGLMWLKDGGCLNKKKWNDALITIVEMNANPGRYSCTGYSANYRDWRLPNVRELDSLINYGESDSYAWMNASGFSSMKGSYYWSSTTNTDKANKAYGVNMKKTRRIVIPKKNKNYMLPVRGGVLPETEEKKY